MNETRNMILAVVLSALVLLGWSALSDRFFPTATPPKQTVENGQVKPIARPEADPTADSPRALQSVSQAIGSTPRVRILTPSLEGTLNLEGARIDDLRLVRHTQDLRRESPSIRLLSPAGAPGAYFASFGWLGQGVQGPDASTVWQASSRELAPGKPVTLSWTNPTGQRFELIVSVDDGYLFTVRQRVSNLGSAPVALQPYALLSRATKSADQSSWTHHVGPMGVFNGAANYDLSYSNLDGQEPGFWSRIFGTSARAGTNTYTGQVSWLGFTDKYWLTAIAPAHSTTQGTFRRSPSGAYQGDYTAAPKIVAPGQAITSETRFFAGAKEKRWLDQYEQQGITKLSKSIDWGWFEWFMRPIFALLLWLFHTLGNFGLAIVALTFIVRGIMYPIFDRQFRSMAAMRVVQPKMKEIQERYKDDRERMQREMLELYKREKINPAAGCLPIFLQIPVFYALYKVLTVTVEMRHQPFYLWIKDLSAPDPLTPVNLFGLLPFDPPGLLHLGVLPILLGVTMWLQFRLNPAPMDPIQKQVFSIMPWVLMFAMAPFAAGLQLYWVVSNILGIAQQKWLYHKYDTERQGKTAAATS